MAPIVNNDVYEPAYRPDKEQLIGIFTGEIKNWSEVGGPDEDVVLVTRPTSSGTRSNFPEIRSGWKRGGFQRSYGDR